MRQTKVQARWALLILCAAGCHPVPLGGRGEVGPPLASLAVSGAEQCADTAYLPTSGLYVVTPLNRPVEESVLAIPSITGVAIRVGWQALQPTAQPPDFSPIDKQLAMARRYQKRVSLSIEAGVETPDWVYAIGARPFAIVLDETAGEHACQRANVPVPWDPVYLDAFRQLIGLAGHRYNRSSLLSHIKVTGISGRGQPAALPHELPHRVVGRNQACTTQDEVAQWQDLGYSRERIGNTWRELLELFTQSFSAHRLSIVVNSEGFPPIGEAGKLRAGMTYDPDLVPELIKSALTDREGRMLIQGNELTAASSYPFPIHFSEQITIGYQLQRKPPRESARQSEAEAREQVVASFDETVRRAVLARARYLELQVEDAANPRLAASLAGARVLLREGQRPARQDRDPQ